MEMGRKLSFIPAPPQGNGRMCFPQASGSRPHGTRRSPGPKSKSLIVSVHSSGRGSWRGAPAPLRASLRRTSFAGSLVNGVSFQESFGPVRARADSVRGKGHDGQGHAC
jgi:hypothetical protein